MLAYSTMPFSYTSRNVFELATRSSVNAPSGVERVSLASERVELVVPQKELFSVWARQEDFDEALRLTRRAPFWSTGPLATTRYDLGTQPPSRRTAHFGTRGGQPFLPGALATTGTDLGESATETIEHVFASRESDSWVQLAPARVPETEPIRGRVLHFDNETRTLEGRYLPDETIRMGTFEGMVQWTGTGAPQNALMRAFSMSMWVQPRGLDDAVLLDVGDSNDEADRVWLGFEGGDLVLRVLDAYGDEPSTALKEQGEVRYALTDGNGDPGLPADSWHHVQIDVRGNRGDQMTMLVNGQARGVRTLGLTRLTTSLDSDSGNITVESTEGFPDRGVLRIGNELIEYTTRSGSSFGAPHIVSGELAGFGGRGARVRYTLAGDGTLTGVPQLLAEYNELNGIASAHAVGTPVSLYGYSLPAATNVPAGGSTLAGDVGLYRVARVIQVGNMSGPTNGDGITAGFISVVGLEAGTHSRATDLFLADADNASATDLSFMDGFPEEGGYAAIVQTRWNGNGIDVSSISNQPLGGVEVISYSRRTRNVLVGITRGNNLPNLRELGTPNDIIGGTRAFVTDWGFTADLNTGQPVATNPAWAVYVVPLSIPVPSSGDLTGLPYPQPGQSEFGQLLRMNTEAEFTEWFRYDELASAGSSVHAVRDRPTALLSAYTTIVGGRPLRAIAGDDTDGDGQGDGSDGGGGPIGDGLRDGETGDERTERREASAPAPAVAAAPQSGGTAAGTQWQTQLGANEMEPFGLSQAVNAALRFRGVMGTQVHAHRAGTQVLPVIRTRDRGPDRGRPGRYDQIFLGGSAGDFADIGFPAQVHRAHLPARESPVYGYTWQATGAVSTGVGTTVISETAENEYPIDGWVYFALNAPAPTPLAPADDGRDLDTVPSDSRLRPRFSKFPSGERPRLPTALGIGSGFSSDVNSRVPSAVVDEIVFGTPEFGRDGTDFTLQGAQLVLDAPLGQNANNIEVVEQGVRIAGGRVFPPNYSAIDGLPTNGGLLRIGDEILAYENADASLGVLTVATSGRGLLGTVAQPHEAGEPVTFLEFWPVTILSGPVSASDGTLPVTDLSGFPFAGTLRIDDELVHYTRPRQGSFEMPRSSTVPGRMDEQGDGIFRGRFGTAAASHAAGVAVIGHPFRYWDRWSDRADAPELAYFGFEVEQPSAWWQGLNFEWEPSGSGGAQIGVLQRTDSDVPWDADPGLEEHLRVLWEGDEGGGLVPMALQADRVEWRVFARYNPNAFDPLGGLSHGWKETPRFRRLAVGFVAPNQVLRSVSK